MNYWLSIALSAYLIGALVEGIGAASQLSHSTPELIKNREENLAEPTASSQNHWQVWMIIAGVSICGAFSWPCRLIHRSIKEKEVP